MIDDKKKNILFVLFVIAVLIMAAIYFSVPERKEFLEFQIKWWKEFWDMIKSFFG